ASSKAISRRPNGSSWAPRRACSGMSTTRSSKLRLAPKSTENCCTKPIRAPLGANPRLPRTPLFDWAGAAEYTRQMNATPESIVNFEAEPEPGTPPDVLVFTDAAAGKVGELIREEANPNLKLRVFVSGGGCSGFQYGFTFDEKVEDGDFCVENRGVQLLVDPMSAQ